MAHSEGGNRHCRFAILHSARRAASRCLFGLAGGGVCPAAAVTGRAVRSYRTISPLPVETSKSQKVEKSKPRGLDVSTFLRFDVFRGRCRFCGTFPRLTPGWRYQPPYPAQFGLSSRTVLPRFGGKPLRAIAFAHSRPNGSSMEDCGFPIASENLSPVWIFSRQPKAFDL